MTSKQKLMLIVGISRVRKDTCEGLVTEISKISGRVGVTWDSSGGRFSYERSQDLEVIDDSGLLPGMFIWRLHFDG
jgi:hypothetical protein